MKRGRGLWSIQALIAFFVLTLLTACGGGAQLGSKPATANLVSVTITPGKASLAKGKSQQFSAQGAYSDGTTKDVTASAAWSSSSAAVATVGNATGTKGMVQAVAVGSSTISAVVPSTETGGTVTGATSLTVSAATLDSLSLAPGTASIALGLKQQFTASGTYSDGTTQDLTSSVTWTSSDQTVATVNAGKVTTLKQGSAVIKAASGSTSSAATLTVAPAALLSILVSPAAVSVPAGKTQQFTAQGTYTDGSNKDLTSLATWSTSAGATINPSGMATAQSTGDPVITASFSGMSSTASMTVLSAALVSITVSPASATVQKGKTQQFTARGTYTDGSTQDLTSSATWTVSTAATISRGLATGAAVGNATVTAGSGTITGTATLTVSAAGLVSITISPASASVPKGTTQQFTAQGTYTDGSTADLTNGVTWTAGSGATVTASGLATAATVGTSVITAKSGLITGTASLTISSAALVSITVTPPSASIVRGKTQQFAAQGTYTDGSTQNLTPSVAWTASPGASIVNGLATATATGAVTITATSGTLSAKATLTITLPAVTSVVISPASVSLGLGGSQPYSAIATYADLIQEDVTATATWHSGNTAVVSISSAGVAQVLATSSTAIAITATFGGVASNTAFLSALASLPRVCPSPTIDMKLLVITNGQTEADFPAVAQILDYVGTPYTVFDMATQTQGITASLLSDGECHGYYQGVILANGGYIYSLPGITTLNSYEVTFHARQVNWFTFPSADFGLTYTGQSISPAATYAANFTTAGASVFSYANTTTPLTISNATVYLATQGTGAVTPLLTDSAGNVVSAVYALSDGREYLTQTFDSNQYLTHDLVLAYGLLNWVTRGVFLGEYHVYATPQIDDVFIDDTNWEADTPCIDPASPTGDRTDPDASTLDTFRIAATDVDALLAWQNLKQQNPLLSNFVLHFAFNGAGTTGRTSTGGYRDDTLTPELTKYQASFKWISHTWDHPDTLDGQTAAFIDSEITKNNQAATSLGLTYYSPANMVTPGITGLNDSTYVNRAVVDGIRNVVTDTSVLNTPNNGPNPSPNVGLVNTINASLYMVPRHANNLFFNVSEPDGWTAEYQCIYSGQAPYSTYTYDQITDNISQTFVADMLKGDMDPQMFHQPNLRAYDGTHSLIGDLYDRTFDAYLSLFKLPVLSPTLDQLALAMQVRDQYNKSGATASLVGGSTIQITVPSTSPVSSATVPITGLNSSGGESYGGQSISHVVVNQGQTATLPLP